MESDQANENARRSGYTEATKERKKTLDEEEEEEDMFCDLAVFDEPTQRVLKFPDIHKDSTFAQAVDLKKAESGQLQEIIGIRS